MSIKLMSIIWEVSNKFLTSTEKTILLRLADFAADDGTSVYPSWERVARDTGVTRSTIARTFSSLQKKNVLLKISEANTERRKTCEYRIMRPLLKSWKHNQNTDDNLEDWSADYNSTRVTVTPVSSCDRCSSDTPPVSLWHPTRVTVTPNTPINHHINHHKIEGDVVASPPFTQVPESKEEKEEVLSKPRKKEVEHMVETWNATVNASGAIPARLTLMSEATKKMALAAYTKLQEDGWQELLMIVSGSPFLNGDNDRFFRINFAWMLKPANLEKIMDGVYSSQLIVQDKDDRSERNRLIREENKRIEELYRGEEHENE